MCASALVKSKRGRQDRRLSHESTKEADRVVPTEPEPRARAGLSGELELAVPGLVAGLHCICVSKETRLRNGGCAEHQPPYIR